MTSIETRTQEALALPERIEIFLSEGRWLVAVDGMFSYGDGRGFETLTAAEVAVETVRPAPIHEWSWVEDGHYILISAIPGSHARRTT